MGCLINLLGSAVSIISRICATISALLARKKFYRAEGNLRKRMKPAARSQEGIGFFGIVLDSTHLVMCSTGA